MKKRILLVGLSMMLCMLCGCLEETPLTDAEMDVVAEYAATLLLKYDENYNTPLYYAEELSAVLSPTPTPTATPIPSQTDAKDPSGNGSAQGTAVTPTPLPYNNEETTSQLTEILAVEDITVSCNGYEPLKSVESKEYFSLVAKEGRQYVVVSFTLHNNTGEELTFDASEKGLEYTLDINTGTVSRVALSMLQNDLQYMPITVPANGTADAVLVFEIAEVEIETAHLIIQSKTDEVVFIKLQ